MPNSTISCSYTLTAVGAQSPAALSARLAAVPVDLTLPLLYGLRYTSDTTTFLGAVVTRTIVFAMTPSTPAAATVSLEAGGVGAPASGVTVGTAGAGYTAAPIVGPSGPATRAAVFRATMLITDVTVISGGSGYNPANSSISMSGSQVAAGGRAGVLTPVFTGGVLTGVTITDPGALIATSPQAIVVDSSATPGKGAVISVGLGVASVTIIDGGVGYTTPPTLAFTPIFKSSFPDTTDQRSALRNFMAQIFRRALNSDVFAQEPVIA